MWRALRHYRAMVSIMTRRHLTVDRARTFLSANKVFFETVVILLVSMMAIIVAIAQTWIAAKQTRLLELQTRVSEVEVLPEMVVLSFASNEGDASWEIRNEGARVREFVFDAGCFLTVSATLGEEKRKVTWQTRLTDCLGSWTASGGGTGVIARVGGLSKVAEVASLQYLIRDAAARRKWTNTKTRVEMVCHLRYRDRLNRPHDDYFASGTFSDTRTVDTIEGAALMQKRDEPNGFSVTAFPLEKVLARIDSR
jgi:hypothetical protein